MKKYTEIIIIMIAVFLITYLSAVFVTLKFNVLEWSQDAREAYLFLSLVLSVLGIIASYFPRNN